MPRYGQEPYEGLYDFGAGLGQLVTAFLAKPKVEREKIFKAMSAAFQEAEARGASPEVTKQLDTLAASAGPKGLAEFTRRTGIQWPGQDVVRSPGGMAEMPGGSLVNIPGVNPPMDLPWPLTEKERLIRAQNELAMGNQIPPVEAAALSGTMTKPFEQAPAEMRPFLLQMMQNMGAQFPQIQGVPQMYPEQQVQPGQVPYPTTPQQLADLQSKQTGTALDTANILRIGTENYPGGLSGEEVGAAQQTGQLPTRKTARQPATTQHKFQGPKLTLDQFLDRFPDATPGEISLFISSGGTYIPMRPQGWQKPPTANESMRALGMALNISKVTGEEPSKIQDRILKKTYTGEDVKAAFQRLNKVRELVMLGSQVRGIKGKAGSKAAQEILVQLVPLISPGSTYKARSNPIDELVEALGLAHRYITFTEGAFGSIAPPMAPEGTEPQKPAPTYKDAMDWLTSEK